MNSYIKHIIEAFDFDSANTQKKNINAYDRLLPILEKVDKHNFCDIIEEEYNILTSFVGVYKAKDRRSLKETVMMFIECFGNECNLNWINTSNITNMERNIVLIDYVFKFLHIYQIHFLYLIFAKIKIFEAKKHYFGRFL